MSRPPEDQGAPITGKAQLVEWFSSSVKPRDKWLIGTEHEKFAFRLSDLKRLPYEGPDGIGVILDNLTRFGWEPIKEHGNTIALTHGGCAITLEPGGQFELSGAPLDNLHQTCNEVHTHLAQVREVCDELGVGMLGIGFDPKWTRDDIGWMPKGRYEIMKRYMPLKGNLGIDMMKRTCTVQVNLDFESEADMVEKYRISLALQPLATALFANSPFYEGKPSGFTTFRSHVWTDTDPDRCGMLPFVFEDGFGFERYVDYLLDVPMYFVYRDNRYIDVAGKSFRDFIAGKLPEAEGHTASMGDWSDHTTTVFQEVRLKKYMEMRGADGGPWNRLCALPALWVGLLYDKGVQDQAWQLCRDWTVEEHQMLRDAVPRDGLKTEFRGRSLAAWSRDVLGLAREGLRRRGRLDSSGNDETGFLGVLDAIAESGRTPAEELLAAYDTRWGGSVDPVFEELRY
ncbi:MAG: glutamate--cysteine ligase [Thalassobaculum sp.]|uniref:glutamate--cysteine ligase n=1 Tax=Thalassobaculum sp. TaxID=2022740 RepID=UPI0032EBA08C